MKTWIKAEFEFQKRAAVLVIGRKEILDSLQDLFAAIRDAKGDEDADRLEPILLAAIARLRPDLAGCTLIGFKYNLAAQAWEILASHSSFPKVAWGDEAPRMPLSRDDESRATPERPYIGKHIQISKCPPSEPDSEKAIRADMLQAAYNGMAQAVLDDPVEREKIVAEIVNAAIVKHRQSGPLLQADEPDAIVKRDHRLVTFG